MRRLGFAALALVLAGVLWFLTSFGRIAAGYAATITALQVFGSGDALATVRAERLALPLGLGRALALSTASDASRHEARAAFLGLIERRAVWRPGLGATRSGDDGPPPSGSIADLVPPLADDAPWPRGESEELAPLAPETRSALDAALESAFVDPASGRARGTHAVVVIQDGRLVAERYRAGYDRRTPILGWSLTKSVLATLFARLLVLGRVASVDQPAAVGEWSAPGDPRGAITYDQLLRMTSGLEFFANYELPWSDSLRMLFASPDVAVFAAEKHLRHPPGTVWAYSDGTSSILGRCVRELVPGGLEAQQLFPQRELFAPLAMSSAVISVDAAGNWVASSLMQASARDWARFGWLYANDGVFEGRRLLPEGWVDYATSPTRSSPQRCYGAHFWRCDAESGRNQRGTAFPPILAGSFYASGHDGQVVWIDRARRIVLVRLGAAGPAVFDAETFAGEILAILSEDRSAGGR